MGRSSIPTPEASSTPLPLDGVKVLDLSRVLAGPWCTQTLADLGAEVWKIESPGHGDDSRIWIPPDVGGEATYFMCANRSKRSLAINLKHPQGQALTRALAAQADVLVENFRLGALKKFGLDYAALSQTLPRLIYCSISGYGRTGPRAGEPGYDFVIQAESGLMSITGEEHGEPMKLGVAITDLITGLSAGQAVLAALLVRQRTGRGQLIDLALFDCAVNALVNVGMGYLAAGDVPARFGNGHPSVVPYQIVSATDGNFALAVGNDRQFVAMCGALGRTDLATDERYRTSHSRVANREVLLTELQGIFATATCAHWLQKLRAAGVPVGAVRTVPEALEAAETKARGLVARTPDARHGSLPLMRSPLAMRGTPPREPSAPPRLGEHTDQVLRSVLGASAEDLKAWRAEGVVA